MSIRILVTGSRDWKASYIVTKAINEFIIDRCGIIPEIDGLDDVVVVHGACPTGVDKIADDYCKRLLRYGIHIERHPAQWRKPNGTVDKSAGFRRNKEMVDMGANVCLAFIKNQSRGASHTAKLAEAAGIHTIRYEK